MEKMEKMKKIILVLGSLLILLFAIPTASAITYEGGTGSDAGGLWTYVRWFDDQKGVLVVSTNMQNNSGLNYADITVLGVCMNESRTFRLRIYDSDSNEYVKPEKELGIGAIERRFSVQAHMDFDYLVWIAQVASEDGLTIFAEIALVYTYNPDSEHKPVDDTKDTIEREEHEKALKKARRENRIAGSIMGFLGVVVAIGYIRRMK